VNHFCTLFDKNYLYQGLTLFRSLERHAKSFVLYAICMDERSFDTVSRLQKPGLVPIPVQALESEETRPVRARTTHGQYCWVCQPVGCIYLLDRFNLSRITYLEADSMFFGDPDLLFEELRNGSASVVPHRFSRRYDFTRVAGKHCVQFNAFRNTPEGRAVLGYWKAECFKYSKDLPTRYPGQMCLNHWSELFPGVRELQHPGAGLAPWNVESYHLSEKGGQLFVDESPVVFYHYHQYARYPNGDHELGDYRLDDRVVDLIYRPYAREIEKTESWVKSVDPAFDFRRTLARSNGLLLRFRRRLRGSYNVYRSL
jgi:hypothetical protein